MAEGGFEAPPLAQESRIDYTERPAAAALAPPSPPQRIEYAELERPAAPSPSPQPQPASAGQRTARDEILASAYRVIATTGRTDFTAAEVLEDLEAFGTSYAENTIKTMVSATLVYDGVLERVNRGVFRVVGAPSPSMPAATVPAVPAVPSRSETPTQAAGFAGTAAAGGRCLGCGKEGLISNTMCRRCRGGA